MKKRPKFHPELPLGKDIEKGTGETFVKSLLANRVDLSHAGKIVKNTLAQIKN